MIFNITLDNCIKKLGGLCDKLEPDKKYKLVEQKQNRSIEISNHFNAHLTQIWQESGSSRLYHKAMVLLTAIEIGAVDGGDEWSYTIVEGVLMPDLSTSGKTNKQMMTAVEACHVYAARNEITLRECENWYDGL